MVKVRKAVIPAAGLGTRFLPMTKVAPKEMLPVVDKPAIQYVVEEAVAAGIEDILIITSPHKKLVEDHFDRAFELEHRLEAKGKTAALEQVKAIGDLARFHFIRQGEPLGLGHAIGMAANHVGDEPFAVLLPDDLMVDDAKVLSGMISAYEENEASVVALRQVPMSEISSYGCASTEAEASGDGSVVKISHLVEKPAAEEAPSNLAVMGRYVFSPSLFRELEGATPGVGGEIQVTDAMATLATGEGLFGYVFTEGRYDTGMKQDYLRAVVELALVDPELGSTFRAFLSDLAKREGLTG